MNEPIPEARLAIKTRNSPAMTSKSKSRSPRIEEKKRSSGSRQRRQVKAACFDTFTEPVKTSKMSSGWGVLGYSPVTNRHQR